MDETVFSATGYVFEKGWAVINEEDKEKAVVYKKAGQ
jgi:hypothetical protein